MAFIWRRRSTSIVKIVAILTAVWFTVAFLIYSDNTQRGDAQDNAGMALHLQSAGGGGGAVAGAYEAGEGYDVKIVNKEDNEVGGPLPLPLVADKPKQVKEDPLYEDPNEEDESIQDNVVVQPNEKVHGGKLIAGSKTKAKDAPRPKKPVDEGKSEKNFLLLFLWS